MRDQFLNERIEYYKELEDAIANAAAADGMEICTREHVKAGLLHLDPDMADHVVSIILQKLGLLQQHSCSCLPPLQRASHMRAYQGPWAHGHKAEKRLSV